MFSLLKRVRLGKLAMCVCVFVNLCTNILYAHLCVFICMCLLSNYRLCIHLCTYVTYSYTLLLDRWMLHGCDQQRLEPNLPDCQYKPNKYLETCTVQLCSEVTTCLCWHKHTLNRCIIQSWGRIVVQTSTASGGKDFKTNSLNL